MMWVLVASSKRVSVRSHLKPPRPDRAAAADAVFDDDLLLPDLGEPVAEDPRRDVRRASLVKVTTTLTG